jgi:hypothetical protein
VADAVGDEESIDRATRPARSTVRMQCRRGRWGAAPAGADPDRSATAARTSGNSTERCSDLAGYARTSGNERSKANLSLASSLPANG